MSRRFLRRSACLAGVAALLVAGGVPAAARAAYTGPQLLSGTSSQEFAEADGPALAGDGEWIAFQGTVSGVPGVYRRNLVTGETDLVAGGNAESPSISADGSVVAFTTTQVLDPTDEPVADRGCGEVYVRNMNVTPARYTLAAALDGTGTGILFSGCSTNGNGFPATGAQAAPGVALSDDGNEVAFTVDSPSNLGLAAGAAATVPASQVAVRNLAAQRTTIVSVTPQGQPTPGGGAYPSTTSLGVSPSAAAEGDGGLSVARRPEGDSTAAISGDGTTVAWLGTDVPAQVPGATDVVPGMTGRSGVNPTDPAGQEAEPLWRRIADGAGAQTVRLMAGSGLDFYSYGKYYAQQALPLEGGTSEGTSLGAPSLSDNGQRVALLADAPPPASLAAVQADPAYASALPADAYVVDVADGVAPRVTPVTEVGNYVAAAPATGAVTAVSISPDGGELALETARTQFALASPALITPPTQYAAITDTYAVNLSAGTMQLLTATFDGSPADGNSGLLSFDDAGDLSAASEAGNLFYGDVNPTSPEVYLYGFIPTTGTVAAGWISSLPGSATALPNLIWTLGATAAARRDGTVVVSARVPGPGTLRATARAQLQTTDPTSRGAGTHAARVAPTRRPRRHHRPAPGRPLPVRVVARAGRTVRGAAIDRVVLHLGRRFRALAASPDGLYATVTVDFTAAGHPALAQQVPVTFRLRAARGDGR
jgi:hypothetical protein